MNLSWKDELLLKEMELFQARDPQQTGPRTPLPDAEELDGQVRWYAGLAESRHAQITHLLDMLKISEKISRRYQRAFQGAAWIAAGLGAALMLKLLGIW